MTRKFVCPLLPPSPYHSSRQTPDFSSGPISQGFLHTHKRSRRRTASITYNHWCPVSPLLLGMNKTNISFAANSISSAPITRHGGDRTAMGRAGAISCTRVHRRSNAWRSGSELGLEFAEIYDRFYDVFAKNGGKFF